MAPLPKKFSVAAVPITAAVHEGRAEDAMDMLLAALESGEADSAVQLIAADWIRTLGLKPGDPKALRQGARALPKEWIEIGVMATDLQGAGRSYDDAVSETAAYFGYSSRHVETCLALYNRPAYDD